MIEYLFIGGPVDGQSLLVTEGRDLWEVLDNPNPDLVRTGVFSDWESKQLAYEIVTYSKMVLTRNISVFAVHGMTIDQVLNRLLRKYQR